MEPSCGCLFVTLHLHKGSLSGCQREIWVVSYLFSPHFFRPADVEIVLVDPDLFQMRIMETTELLEAINEAECVSCPNPCPALSLRSSSSLFWLLDLIFALICTDRSVP